MCSLACSRARSLALYADAPVLLHADAWPRARARELGRAGLGGSGGAEEAGELGPPSSQPAAARRPCCGARGAVNLGPRPSPARRGAGGLRVTLWPWREGGPWRGVFLLHGGSPAEEPRLVLGEPACLPFPLGTQRRSRLSWALGFWGAWPPAARIWMESRVVTCGAARERIPADPERPRPREDSTLRPGQLPSHWP